MKMMMMMSTVGALVEQCTAPPSDGDDVLLCWEHAVVL